MAEPFGPYRLERTINVGSIGQVFLARRIGDQQGDPDRVDRDGMHPVVVKRLHRELARRPAHVQLFLEEGRMARRFRHRHLVHAFDAGTVDRDHDRDHYIAMELVRGPNLAQLVERGPVAPPTALRIAIDLCSALDHLHGNGVVHCDLSPTNILIGPERAQLTDFGVTNPVGQPQPQVRGTIPYMSPEQARGLAVDGRSDLFGVGVILWELLARRPLFHRSATYLSLAAVVEDAVPELGAVTGQAVVPALAPVEALLARALAKDPGERLLSCADLGDSLAEAARSLTS